MHSSSIRLVLLCLFILLQNIPGNANTKERWTNYTVNNGLVDNYVECLLEDKRGFLWIGTWSGISRFDGNEFKHYRKEFSDSISLPGNWIYCIYQDQSNRLWAGTDEGLAVYNDKLDVFQTVTSVGAHSIVSIKEDSKGFIWVSGDYRLYQIDPTTYQLKFNKSFQADLSSPFEIGPMAIDAMDRLWIGTSSQGIIQFDIPTKSYTLSQRNDPLAILINQHINCIDIYPEGITWIGTMNNGLYRWDSQNKKLENFSHKSSHPQSLADNRVKSTYQDYPGTYYLVSPNGYINQLSLTNNKIEQIEINQQLLNSDDKIPTSCFLKDRNGNEWVGTHGNGLLNRNRQKEAFLTIGASGNKVTSFLCLPNNKILVGTDGGGLNVFDRDTHDYSPLNTVPTLQRSKILGIERISQNEAWLSLWSGGIASLDLQTLRIKKHYPGNQHSEPLFNSSDIKKIIQHDSLLWVLSNGEGIFLYNVLRKKFIDRSNTSTPFDLSIPKWGNSILIDSDRKIWIATSKGLYLYDKNKLKHFVQDNNNPNSIISNLIMAVYEDSRGRIWVLTDGGLELYDQNIDGFSHMSLLYPIPHQLKGIIEDKRGRLWLSSNEGITCFDPVSKKTITYTTDNGLPGNFFYHQAVSSTPDGYLLFGSLDGFTIFHPDSLSIHQIIPQPIFTDFLINYNSPIPSPTGIIQEHIQSLQKITLDYSSDMITFKFISVDLCNAQNLRYSYCLKGQADSWIDIGKQNSVSFSNLSPGDYELNILARNVYGTQAKNPASIHIRILPPWYQTWWAYLIYGVVFLTILYFIYYFLRLRLKTKSKLQIKEFEHKKELELYESKLHFFTSLSHDIRTPLTLIITPLEILKEKISTHPEALKILSILEKNAHHLLELTNELLDFKNLKSGSRNLKIENFNLMELTEEVLTDFSNEFLIRSINSSKDLKNCSVNADQQLIRKVLNNLFINACKFTPKNGRIHVSLDTKANTVEFIVYNSGSFIPEELKTKIFDPLYTSDNNQGYGLGLSITKEIILLHHGNIEAYNHNGGVEFKMTFPVNLNSI